MFNQPERWNIFARELEDVLKVRNLQLGHLDDRKVVLHREKVRRLQHSLASPKHLTTLNPVEMERLTTIMRLTELEQIRLRAALLATAVEMTLIDRVEADIALMAANEVFNTLFAAMKAQPNMVMTTRVRAGAMIEENDTFGDALFIEALDMIDRATLALHVSRSAASLQAQIIHAREAFDAFTHSLNLLWRAQSPLPNSEDWHSWYDEAIDGKKMAEELMNGGEEV